MNAVTKAMRGIVDNMDSVFKNDTRSTMRVGPNTPLAVAGDEIHESGRDQVPFLLHTSTNTTTQTYIHSDIMEKFEEQVPNRRVFSLYIYSISISLKTWM
jgi:hypothetical protein